MRLTYLISIIYANVARSVENQGYRNLTESIKYLAVSLVDRLG